MPAQRSRTAWSWSTTARITVRMSNGFLRSGFVSAEKMSPTVVKSLIRVDVREVAHVAVERVGGLRPPREALARRDVGVVVVREQDVARRR